MTLIWQKMHSVGWVGLLYTVFAMYYIISIIALLGKGMLKHKRQLHSIVEI